MRRYLKILGTVAFFTFWGELIALARGYSRAADLRVPDGLADLALLPHLVLACTALVLFTVCWLGEVVLGQLDEVAH